MHILALPKWYPNEADVQLGSFIQKQFQAVSEVVRVSVVYVAPASKAGWAIEKSQEGDLWEVRSYFRPAENGPVVFRRAVNFFRYWRTMANALARVRVDRGKPDLAHVHVLTVPALVARWLKLKWGLPYLVTEHSSAYITGAWSAHSFLPKAVDRWLMRGAAKVTAVSPHLAAALERNGLAKDPVVVPNIVPGIDRPLPPPGPATDFLMVADLVDNIKNISGVLRAFQKASSGRTGWRLTIIGGGADREILQELSRTLGLETQVHWLGRLANSAVLDRMPTCGTVIVNSNVETFSIVTGEALALGKPVIATRCGGPQTLIRDGNGVLIPVKDDAALAAAMREVASKHDAFPPQKQRDSLGGKFTPSAVGQQYVSIYRSILGHA
ncbi:MAG: glycosyltransferase [Flavobacteriales bacterium]